MTVFYAVEDAISEAVALRLILECIGADADPRPLGSSQGGFGHIRKNLAKYANIPLPNLVLIMTDLDNAECAPSLRREWMAANRIHELPRNMSLCIVVREVEAWLFGDRDGLSRFLSIDARYLEIDPEGRLHNPKAALIAAARQSRDRSLKHDLLPARGSAAATGLGYNPRMVEFVHHQWNPRSAAASCPSLERAMERLQTLTD